MSALPKRNLIAQIDVDTKPHGFAFTLDVYGTEHEIHSIELSDGTDVTNHFLEAALEWLQENG